ncbi:uncharacterized protein LOC105438442 [Strongylocentrotus purpuratus]|uniref:Uncharacterized protein n=1 Tax=Strongylocentrotus purpuratus TaxID=7668 RepID=A0A7M7NUM6_STRPU|nr:uncharacterized protein LOC105438442 [Strongylocentrotus purpuratus]
MGNQSNKPNVVVASPTPNTTTKPTTKPITPTIPPTIATTTPVPTTTPLTTTPLTTTPLTTTPLNTTTTPARVTSTGLITHSSINQLETFLLPVAIVMSTSFLIVAVVLIVVVVRRRHHADKHVENGTHPVFTPTQTVSNASFNAESSGECSLNHIYVEHGERDSKLHDGHYTYVTKPSIMGGFPKGCAPSIKSPKRVLRGYPDGKGRSVQAKGITTDVFGDEDHYDLLFEARPSVVNVIVMNAYENHPPNGCYRNYANVTEIPESTTGYLETLPSGLQDTISIKSSSDSMNNQDPSQRTVSADLQSNSATLAIKSDNPATDYDPNGPVRMLKPNNPEVIIGVIDELLYENAPRSRGGSVMSLGKEEPKYYELERQFIKDADNDNDMVETILYQSITE